MRRAAGGGGGSPSAPGVHQLAPAGPQPSQQHDLEAPGAPAPKVHGRRRWLKGALLGSRPGRTLAAGTLVAAAFLLLLWTGQRLAPSLPGDPLLATDQQATQEQWHPGRARGVLVEFSAPGLLLPLREALDAAQKELPPELALLDLLPPEGTWGAAGASGRPSLEQVLLQYEAKAGAAGGGGVAASSKPVTGSGAAGAAAAGAQQQQQQQQGPGQQGASPQPQKGPVELANEIQFTIQQAEEAARREQRAQQEAARRRQEGKGDDGESQPATYEEAASLLLQRANERHPLDWLPSPLGAAAGALERGAAALGHGGVRMLVGVVSACCSEAAAKRRAVIRETWGMVAREHPGISLRFFLAQPTTRAAAATWLPIIQEEVLASNDTVVLRGPDTYRNLPNKTLRLMRYFLAHPAGYTHLLKTDDDCYVRIDQVLSALRQPVVLSPSAMAAEQGGQPRTPQPSAVRPRRLPAMHAQLLEMMGRDDGRDVLYTDGIQLYNATTLVRTAGTAAGRTFLDDAEGDPVSLADLAGDAAAAAHQRQAQLQQEAWQGGRQLLGWGSNQHAPRMTGVYLGCLENKGGFFPIRDPKSKWYVPFEELPDSAVPFAVKYLAGWGVVLSRDLAQHAAAKANLFQRRPDLAPAWFGPLHWEDVMLGLLLEDAVPEPQDHQAFRAAWRACPSGTAVKHLDVDAPRLVRGLYEQDVSGLWDQKPVQCAAGDYLPGDYSGWKQWRDRLESVEHI